jgi:hypothetical protein
MDSPRSQDITSFCNSKIIEDGDEGLVLERVLGLCLRGHRVEVQFQDHESYEQGRQACEGRLPPEELSRWENIRRMAEEGHKLEKHGSDLRSDSRTFRDS